MKKKIEVIRNEVSFLKTEKETVSKVIDMVKDKSNGQISVNIPIKLAEAIDLVSYQKVKIVIHPKEIEFGESRTSPILIYIYEDANNTQDDKSLKED